MVLRTERTVLIFKVTCFRTSRFDTTHFHVHSRDGNLFELSSKFDERAAGGEFDWFPLLPMCGGIVIGQVNVRLTQQLHGMDQRRLLGMKSVYEISRSLHFILHVQ